MNLVGDLPRTQPLEPLAGGRPARHSSDVCSRRHGIDPRRQQSQSGRTGGWDGEAWPTPTAAWLECTAAAGRQRKKHDIKSFMLRSWCVACWQLISFLKRDMSCRHVYLFKSIFRHISYTHTHNTGEQSQRRHSKQSSVNQCCSFANLALIPQPNLGWYSRNMYLLLETACSTWRRMHGQSRRTI